MDVSYRFSNLGIQHVHPNKHSKDQLIDKFFLKFVGHNLVSFEFNKETNFVFLYIPEPVTTSTVPIVDKTPNKDIYDKTLNGKKTGGVITKNAKTLKISTEYFGNKAFEEYANKMRE